MADLISTDWIKRVAVCSAALLSLLAFAEVASAQVPSPGYIFVEVRDERERPVFSATVVVYNEEGGESRSAATNPAGEAVLMENGDGKRRFAFRIVKPGYLTFESMFETSGKYRNTEINVRLVKVPVERQKPAREERGSAAEPRKRRKRNTASLHPILSGPRARAPDGFLDSQAACKLRAPDPACPAE